MVLISVVPGHALASSGEKGASLVGKPSPVFECTNVEGTKFFSSRLFASGKATLLNFWGLRCSACLQELPHLNSLFDGYGDKVEFFGINVDGIDGKVLSAQIKAMKIDIRFNAVPDPDFKVSDSFGMLAAPLTVIIDKAGVVRFRHESYEPGDEKKLEEALKRVIEGKETELH